MHHRYERRILADDLAQDAFPASGLLDASTPSERDALDVRFDAAVDSGGVAYVIDWDRNFAQKCNQEMVTLESLEDPEEINFVRQMIQNHAEYTGSLLAYRILSGWDGLLSRIVKVLPKDYSRMLYAISSMEEAGLSGEEAVMAAFELNSADQAARVSGN